MLSIHSTCTTKHTPNAMYWIYLHGANGFCYMHKVLLLRHSSLSLLLPPVLLFLFQIMFNIKFSWFFFRPFILFEWNSPLVYSKFCCRIVNLMMLFLNKVFETQKCGEKESQSWIWFCVLFFEITFAPHLFMFCILSNADARKSPYGSGLTIICVDVQT